MNLNPVTCKSFLFLIQMDVPLQQIVYRCVTVEDYLSAVMTFRPEFLNRIDDVITFNELSISAIEPIVDLQLEQVRDRLQARHITLDVTPAAMEHLAIDGYDPVYGARPLKRYIQQKVETLVARDIIQNDPAPGDTITVDVKDGALALV